MNRPPPGLVSESEREVGAGGHLLVPEEHQVELGWRWPKQRQNRVRRYSAIDGLL
jgi:hypothetical protein